MSKSTASQLLFGKCLPIFLLVISIVFSSCGPQATPIVGRWTAEKSPAVSLYFYRDGTASLSGVGLLKLEWKEIDNETARIDALDKKIVFHFKRKRDAHGVYGTLELAGYDTLIFRKTE
jgi:hypothetical protein